VILFMSSVQLICMGIVGEYIRLIFLETKGRPSYIIESLQSGRSFLTEGNDSCLPPAAGRMAQPWSAKGLSET
jgi:hypothetical protein